MSEMTLCNYCSLRDIRSRAKRDGKEVTVRGNNVYVHPPGADLKPTKLVDDGSICASMDEAENPYRVAWMMEIPSHCCC